MPGKMEDRRIGRTRKLLQEALIGLIVEKGYEAITVQDIIDRANVGRTTFYAHFQDKESLFLSGFESMRSMFEKHLNSQPHENEGPWGVSLALFQHAQENLHLYKAMAGRESGNLALNHLQRYLSTMLQAHFRESFPQQDSLPVPPDIFAHFMSSSFLSLLTWWLDHNLPYPPERINEIYRRLTEPALNAIFPAWSVD